jgi:hypothetical protein
MCNTYEIHSCALDDKKGKMSKTSFYEIFISFIVLCQKILAVISGHSVSKTLNFSGY